MTCFVKSLDKEGPGFLYLRKSFPKLSNAKVNAGIFVRPQIPKILKDPKFDSVLGKTELEAWQSFKNLAKGFLGNHKRENYKELVSKLVQSYRKQGCLMHHLLDSHLDFFRRTGET